MASAARVASAARDDGAASASFISNCMDLLEPVEVLEVALGASVDDHPLSSRELRQFRPSTESLTVKRASPSLGHNSFGDSSWLECRKARSIVDVA